VVNFCEGAFIARDKKGVLLPLAFRSLFCPVFNFDEAAAALCTKPTEGQIGDQGDPVHLSAEMTEISFLPRVHLMPLPWGKTTGNPRESKEGVEK